MENKNEEIISKKNSEIKIDKSDNRIEDINVENENLKAEIKNLNLKLNDSNQINLDLEKNLKLKEEEIDFLNGKIEIFGRNFEELCTNLFDLKNENLILSEKLRENCNINNLKENNKDIEIVAESKITEKSFDMKIFDNPLKIGTSKLAIPNIEIDFNKSTLQQTEDKMNGIVFIFFNLILFFILTFMQ